ncbi:MAG: hypothetical protein Q9208_002880 [Pyrenodesmia sp. 3 TL-2023]
MEYKTPNTPAKTEPPPEPKSPKNNKHPPTMIFETHTTREAWEASRQQHIDEVMTWLINEGASPSEAAKTPTYTDDDIIQLARKVRQRGIRASAALEMDFGTAIGLGRKLQRCWTKLYDVDTEAWVEQRMQLGAQCDVLERVFDLVRSERRQLKRIHILPAEERKRLIKELDPLTLELTHLCISQALKTLLPPNIENLVSKILKKRKLLYRDDLLNVNIDDGDRMAQIQDNGEWIKL